ncbi:THAP-type domain-containing protein [Aphis craccivora]|uniref:THAP-type domain-containing protein n=1 Tax=Aphis craccivora TaxID=307492 RepID=A0A6G0YF17_APHCR|nr:THAP-type domain-containing protein [Aphis craccivora]
MFFTKVCTIFPPFYIITICLPKALFQWSSVFSDVKMVQCWVPLCSHISNRETCKFFKFPANDGECKVWNTYPTKNNKICIYCLANFTDLATNALNIIYALSSFSNSG